MNQYNSLLLFSLSSEISIDPFDDFENKFGFHWDILVLPHVEEYLKNI